MRQLLKTINNWVWYAVGAVILAVPAFPVAAWIGAGDPGPDWAGYLSGWALGITVVITIAVLAGRVSTTLKAPAWRGVYGWKVAVALGIGLTLASVFVMNEAFARNPQLVDEMALLFTAKTFSSGRVVAPPPDPAGFFLITWTFVNEQGWVSHYPPVQSALLAVGFLLRSEWLVNPVLGGLSTVLVYLTARGLYGVRTATVSALLWATAGWVVIMSGTYVSHVSSAFFSLGAWAALFAPQTPRLRHFILAGFALSLAAASRPLDAVAAAVPILVWVAARPQLWKKLPWMAVAGMPVMLAWAAVNQAAYGTLFTLGYTRLFGASHALGFYTDPYGEPFTPLVALANLSTAVRRLHIYLFEWPIPALLPLGLWALVPRRKSVSDLVVGSGILITPFLYFFYWHSGFFLGPRFYYALVPWVVIGTALAWLWLWERARAASHRLVRWDVASAAGAITVLIWGAVVVFPIRYAIYRDALPSLKLHPEQELRGLGVTQAVVLVPVSWGSRTIAKLWGLGVIPGLVERAYRWLDACTLHEFAEDDARLLQSPTEISRDLEALMGEYPVAAVAVPGFPDPTLKIHEGQFFSPSCEVQLQRDFEGFTLYPNLAWRNDVELNDGIVFARDRFEENDELLQKYPGWAIWRYAPPTDAPNALPVLQLMEAGSAGG